MPFSQCWRRMEIRSGSSPSELSFLGIPPPAHTLDQSRCLWCLPPACHAVMGLGYELPTHIPLPPTPRSEDPGGYFRASCHSGFPDLPGSSVYTAGKTATSERIGFPTSLRSCASVSRLDPPRAAFKFQPFVVWLNEIWL